MDTLGQILWFSIFLTPLLTIPLALKLKSVRRINQILIGIVFAAILSVLLYSISFLIIFRDGMGPT